MIKCTRSFLCSCKVPEISKFQANLSSEMKPKLLFSSISSSSLNPLSKYSYGCCYFPLNRNLGAAALQYFSIASSPLSESLKDTLYDRLLRVSSSKDSVFNVIDKWAAEGRHLDYFDVRKVIKQFKSYRRFSHALQISEWQEVTEYVDFTAGDAAIRLNLISKVYGLEHAQKYFDSMPDDSRAIQIYGALLSCYADAKVLDKAEAIMEKMRKLGYAERLAYSVMLKLYSQMAKHEKLNSLVQEMEEKGIHSDVYVYNIRLNAYVATSDVIGMEKLLTQMEADSRVAMDPIAYSIAGNGYLKVGASEKAEMMLKKSEQLITGREKNTKSYDVLISLYARLGRKDEVHRLWNLQKKSGKFYNVSYFVIISALVKLDDLDGAETILEEWLAKTAIFNNGVPNLLLTAYCQKGHMEKAESLVNKLIESGKSLNASTWSRMAWGYSKMNQMEQAVEMTKRALAVSTLEWEPDLPTLSYCLEYLKGKGDEERTKEVEGLLGDQGLCRLEKYRRKGNLASKKLNNQMEQEPEKQEAEISGDFSFKIEST